MKKNISINISGIIFYIEEDGYDKLKEYLDSINQYFSKFDDSNEIISDIESRIAEIFLSKLKDGKQVIYLEDVDSLIATMGSIRDFKAVEEPQEAYEETSEETYSEKSKKLFRDTKRKIISGVAAGIGHYFNVDPLWIRLLFLLFFFAFFFEFEISLIIPLIYGVLWIIIPGSDELKEEKKYKKMFRNPDDKVLGGVSSGIAAYFGIDIVVVRVLFVLLIFVGFSGPIIYIVLWIILPEAKSITDKMEMQGEPVTLSNIEENIKKSFNVKEGEENVVVKILLFPFRLIALLINSISKGLGPLLKFLVEAIRVLVGILIILTGVSTLFGLIVYLGVIIGIFATGDWFVVDFLPIEVIRNSLPVGTAISLFLVLFVPFLLLTLLGVMIISKQNLIKPGFGWSIFAVWIISLAYFTINVPRIVQDFSEEGNREVVTNLDIKGTAKLGLREAYDTQYEVTSLRLRGHEDSTFRLVQKFTARGGSRSQAIAYSEMVGYDYQVEDSLIIFDDNLYFKDDAVFRLQELSMTLYIPYNHPFTMERELSEILRNTLYIYGYRSYQMENNTWVFTEDGLKCVTCPDDQGYENNPESPDAPQKPDFEADFNDVDELRDFNFIDIGNTFILNISQDDEYSVSVSADEKDLGKINFDQQGDLLKIRFRDSNYIIDASRQKIKVNITMPELKGIDLHGGSQTYISGFKPLTFGMDLSGTAFAEIEIETDQLEADLSGASKLVLKGNGKSMDLQINGIANVDAFDYPVDEANINADAASTANILVNKFLQVDAGAGSTVRYKGNPKLDIENDIGSNVQKVD